MQQAYQNCFTLVHPNTLHQVVSKEKDNFIRETTSFLFCTQSIINHGQLKGSHITHKNISI